MSFSGLMLTKIGRMELAQAEMGEKYEFTKIVIGDKAFSGSFTEIGNIINPVMEIAISKIERVDDEITIECEFNSIDVPKAFYMREVGIYVNGKLCYYDNTGNGDAEYINPESGAIVKQKRMRFVLIINSDVQISAVIASSLYAMADDLDKHVTDDENPHGVTKDQVGLGNVANVATNDQTPTFIAATTLATLTSGEKLSISMGKIAKAIADLISHISNKSNPHGVTKSQVGLGNVDNTTDKNKPVSTSQQVAIDTAYANGNKYTDQKIANLINGAPSTLDTLKEVADAIEKNKSVADALDAAIGTKASQAELETIENPTFADYETSTSSMPTLEDALKGIKSGATIWTILGNIKASLKNIFSSITTLNNNFTNVANGLQTEKTRAIAAESSVFNYANETRSIYNKILYNKSGLSISGPTKIWSYTSSEDGEVIDVDACFRGDKGLNNILAVEVKQGIHTISDANITAGLVHTSMHFCFNLNKSDYVIIYANTWAVENSAISMPQTNSIFNIWSNKKGTWYV